MDPISCIALASTITGVISNVATQIMAIKMLHDQIRSADAHLMSLIAQLNTIKAALDHIQQLIQISEYDQQLQFDLDLSLQASQLHMDFIAAKISKLTTNNAGRALKFRSKVKVVFESDSMAMCLDRLNHQATALNLLITVLTSKSVTEQKAMLQRSNTRKVFKQVQEDRASLLDDSASVLVLRDDQSVLNAAARSKSEPIVSKSPWKRFSFDRQVLSSKAYGVKTLRQQSSEKNLIVEEVRDVDAESFDDAITVAEDSDEFALGSDGGEDLSSTSPRFSRMLAFAHAECGISSLVHDAQRLWKATAVAKTQSLPVNSAINVHRLSTRYFDLSIHAHRIEQKETRQLSDDYLASYKDVSSILFAIRPSVYQSDVRRMKHDLRLFDAVANDYHLWLAKIILFFDTTDLDLDHTSEISRDLERQFRKAGRAGASGDRLQVVVGNADETSAGTIFAVCNETGRMQANKWAGLSRWETE